MSKIFQIISYSIDSPVDQSYIYELLITFSCERVVDDGRNCGFNGAFHMIIIIEFEFKKFSYLIRRFMKSR